MIRVTVSSISSNGVHPQYYDEFETHKRADEYIEMIRKGAAKAGALVRIDKKGESE